MKDKVLRYVVVGDAHSLIKILDNNWNRILDGGATEGCKISRPYSPHYQGIYFHLINGICQGSATQEFSTVAADWHIQQRGFNPNYPKQLSAVTVNSGECRPLESASQGNQSPFIVHHLVDCTTEPYL